MARQKRYNYIKKRLAGGTWEAVAATVLALLLAASSLFVSVHFEGRGPMLVGALELSSMVLAGWCVVRMLLSMKEENRNFLPIRICAFLSGILLFAGLAFILLGM